MPPSKFRSANKQLPWTDRDRDKCLNLFCQGESPRQIALALKRDPYAIKMLMGHIFYNNQPWVVKYKPHAREVRNGKEMTRNERRLVKAHKMVGVSPEVTATFLMRRVSEVRPGLPQPKDRGPYIIPPLDLIRAYRYLYHVSKVRIVTDDHYDEMKDEEIEFGAGAKYFEKLPGLEPIYIRDLATYLLYQYQRKTHPRDRLSGSR